MNKATLCNTTSEEILSAMELMPQVEIPDEKDQRFSVLSYEQVKRLNDLMSETIPIHGRGNFPTLDVKLSHLGRRFFFVHIQAFFVHISHHLFFTVKNIVLNRDTLIESRPFPCSFLLAGPCQQRAF